ncbi:MAG: redoxin family protein [Kofleriaceae bacterium]
MLRAIALTSLVACSTTAPTKTEAPTRSAPAPAPPAPAPDDPAPDDDRAAKARVAIAALVGTTPAAWKAERWMNSAPIELAKLRGSVVLVRWWTAGCPFCSTTAPSLREIDRLYAPRGLRVIGMYHHKEEAPFEPAVYEDTAKKFGFTFPVAVDPDWYTLESWLHDRDGKAVSTGWTSVTFVLDRRGVIRHVHPGGSYVAGEPAYDEMRAVIERLLAE